MESPDFRAFKERLQKVLRHEVAHRNPWGTDLKAPENPFPASVLMLWAFHRLHDNESPQLLFIRRAEDLKNHRGQLAFPGGRKGAEESSKAAALRETSEEVGVGPEKIEIQGALPPLLTSSSFLVTPWLGILGVPLHEADVFPQRGEVDEVFWLSWDQLRAEGVYRLEEWEFEVRGQKIYKEVDVFRVGDRVIWGATGSMLWNFFKRWDEVT